MNSTFITSADDREAKIRAMELERRHRMRKRLCNEVETMLSHGESDGLMWTGTQTDLMEALHLAYIYGRMTNDDGELVNFSELVKMACNVLHVKEPRNPWAKVGRAGVRKGVRRSSLMKRYNALIDKDPKAQPLRQFVVRKQTTELVTVV
ncbi:MAG: hypothetical protein K5893_03490 [Prevotella sp.]|nr:hypothetical protein [Prevotella sp.]